MSDGEDLFDKIEAALGSPDDDVAPDRPGYDADGYDDMGWRRRLQPSEWRALEPFVHPHDAEPGDGEALEAAIEAAADERPLQAFLQERPRLLTASFLDGGHGRYVRPQVRLGAEWVSDFLIAEASSMGLFWQLVELESPRAALFTRSGEWAEKARHAIHQVQRWRHWLGENLDYARKPPKAGLGLVDIESSPEALILIGRHDAGVEEANWLRRDLLREQRIRVHTYDELLQRVRSSERSHAARGRR